MNEIIGNYRVIGVSRGNEFSPNHVGNDAAIFNAAAEQLRKRSDDYLPDFIEPI